MRRFPDEEIMVNDEGGGIFSISISDEEDINCHLDKIKIFINDNGAIIKKCVGSGKFNYPHIDIAFEPDDNRNKIYSEIVIDSNFIEILNAFKIVLHISIYANQ